VTRRISKEMVILITGASSGIGRYTAQKFHKEGHTVYGTSRNPEKKDSNSEKKDGSPEKKDNSSENSGNGPKGNFNMIQLDVCDPESCSKAVSYVMEKEGRIDVLVNNAGIGIAGAVELTSDDEAKSQFETNFFGAVRMCREVLPIMRNQGRGKIINVTSVAAAVPIPFQAMYSACKAALESVSQCLRMETKHYGINVTAIEFGDIKTGFTGSRKITEASQRDEVYKKTFEKSLKTMEHDEQNGPRPFKAADLVYKTALGKNSRPVIVCGFKYKAVAVLRRKLPYRFTEFSIGKIYANYIK